MVNKNAFRKFNRAVHRNFLTIFAFNIVLWCVVTSCFESGRSIKYILLRTLFMAFFMSVVSWFSPGGEYTEG